ncbi:uncharacterized protein CEXT_358921 [Caerostris extrusa]|uniref:Uncharacterized protein n=1 Tax=Caerostris extrusa TaxID=172846 RepID=A0AAV4THN0_CAEEX|nr:uncharacterized protein CEXT_358921 [Caerostris extrusa]
MFALGVTTTPYAPGKPPPIRIPNGITGQPHFNPFQHFNVHANTYPNYPYFQGALTTPLSNDHVPGRLMYSGYKPPKTTEGTKLPRTTSLPKVTKTMDNNSRSPPRQNPTQSYYRSHPTQSYYRPKPTPSYNRPKPSIQEHRINYNSPHTGENSPYMPNFEELKNQYLVGEDLVGKEEDHVLEQQQFHQCKFQRYITNTITSRTNTFTTPSYTSIPLNPAVPNSLQSIQETSKGLETSSHYPPAGYYGKDQLVQFFDSSAKSYNKVSTPTPYEQNDLGENTSSAEIEETITSASSEDPDQPAFGTRLRSKPRSQNRREKDNKHNLQLKEQKYDLE